jgi:hypothetical protein
MRIDRHRPRIFTRAATAGAAGTPNDNIEARLLRSKRRQRRVPGGRRGGESIDRLPGDITSVRDIAVIVESSRRSSGRKRRDEYSR